MKKTIRRWTWCAWAGVMGLLNVQCTGEMKETITVDFNVEYQTMDGFGVAEADYADDVFVFPKRDEVLDALFGRDGLQLNILRGEIFPHYSNRAGVYDFGTASDTSMNAVRNASEIERNDLLRRGQYWLNSRVKRDYPNVKPIFSVWSPPAWMKEGGHATEIYPASGGWLKKEHYQSFADYLAAFYKAFRGVGVETYAISPSNEPGYAAPWNSCVWTAEQMGEFVHDYLLPTFRKDNIPTKVLFGENPTWSNVFDKFTKISSAEFVNGVLRKYPDMEAGRVIAAGHGYVLPDSLPIPKEMLKTPIVPFEEAVKRNIPMWVTEVSDISPTNVSMKDGLYWAKMFHRYLMDAHVSAFVWWCGAMPTTTNESLIVLNRESGEYMLTKRYETFGNYTKFIPEGSICIDNRISGLPDSVDVTTFTKDKEYTVVVVNPTDSMLECRLKLDGARAQQNLDSYTTTAEKRWAESSVKMTGGAYNIALQPQSVTTFVGRTE